MPGGGRWYYRDGMRSRQANNGRAYPALGFRLLQSIENIGHGVIPLIAQQSSCNTAMDR